MNSTRRNKEELLRVSMERVMYYGSSVYRAVVSDMSDEMLMEYSGALSWLALMCEVKANAVVAGEDEVVRCSECAEVAECLVCARCGAAFYESQDDDVCVFCQGTSFVYHCHSCGKLFTQGG